MKRSRYFTGLRVLFSGVLLAALFLLAGCETEKPFADASTLPGLPPTATNTAAINEHPVAVGSNTGSNTGNNTNAPSPIDVFHVGDMVVVRVESHKAELKFDPYAVTIREDGTITTTEGTLKAAERSMAEVQSELQRLYDKKYVGVTVFVSTGDRWIHVLGEVNSPGQKQYVSRMDIIAAVTSAGGPTIFASNGIILLHPNGKMVEVDYKKALRQDPKHNLPVFPGDKIFVKKRWI